MWRTVAGERVLEGAEAKVFALSLLDLLGNVVSDTNGIFETEIDIFDRLTVGQKVTALSTVANGLLRKEFECINLSAALEAAIAAVYEHAKVFLTLECDDSEELTVQWRKLIWDARKQVGASELPSPDSVDVKEWCWEVDALKDHILWDEDYKMEKDFVDESPEKSQSIKKGAGIYSDYFVDIPGDLRNDELDEVCKELNDLCRRFI